MYDRGCEGGTVTRWPCVCACVGAPAGAACVLPIVLPLFTVQPSERPSPGWWWFSGSTSGRRSLLPFFLLETILSLPLRNRCRTVVRLLPPPPHPILRPSPSSRLLRSPPTPITGLTCCTSERRSGTTDRRRLSHCSLHQQRQQRQQRRRRRQPGERRRLRHAGEWEKGEAAAAAAGRLRAWCGCGSATCPRT